MNIPERLKEIQKALDEIKVQLFRAERTQAELAAIKAELEAKEKKGPRYKVYNAIGGMIYLPHYVDGHSESCDEYTPPFPNLIQEGEESIAAFRDVDTGARVSAFLNQEKLQLPSCCFADQESAVNFWNFIDALRARGII